MTTLVSTNVCTLTKENISQNPTPHATYVLLCDTQQNTNIQKKKKIALELDKSDLEVVGKAGGPGLYQNIQAWTHPILLKPIGQGL
jgi:hypothetical protein